MPRLVMEKFDFPDDKYGLSLNRVLWDLDQFEYVALEYETTNSQFPLWFYFKTLIARVFLYLLIVYQQFSQTMLGNFCRSLLELLFHSSVMPIWVIMFACFTVLWMWGANLELVVLRLSSSSFSIDLHSYLSEFPYLKQFSYCLVFQAVCPIYSFPLLSVLCDGAANPMAPYLSVSYISSFPFATYMTLILMFKTPHISCIEGLVKF